MNSRFLSAHRLVTAQRLLVEDREHMEIRREQSYLFQVNKMKWEKRESRSLKQWITSNKCVRINGVFVEG